VLILGILGGILSARLLGPQGRGELATALVWVALLAALADLGVSQAVTYHVAKGRERVGAITGTAIGLALLTGSLATCFSFFVLLPLLTNRGAAVESLRLYLFSIPISLTLTVLGTTFLGLGQFKTYNFLRIAQSGGYVLGVALSALMHWSQAWNITLLMLIMQLLSAIAGAFFLGKQIPFGEWSLRLSSAQELLRYGLKTYAGNLAWLGNGKLDQMLCSILLSSEAVGLYSVAVAYGSLLFSVSGAFATITFQRVASAVSREAALETFQKLLYWNAGLSLLLSVFLMLAAKYLIPLAFGNSFLPSVKVAEILTLGGALLGINYVLSNGLRGMGRPLEPTKAEATGLVINVLAISYFAPRWGLMGTAVATSLSYGAAFSFLFVTFAREKRLARAGAA